MKTMNHTSTPWRVKTTPSGCSVVCDDMGNQIAALSNAEVDALDAAMIIQAVNEHAALVAVAETAQYQYRYASLDAQAILGRLAVNANVPDEDRRKAARALEQLFKATNLIDKELAALAAVRGGKGVAS